MRLIDADEAKKLYKEQCVGDCGCCSDLQDDNTCTLIDRVPTVDDAVIVTRCKDCKYVRDLGFDFGGKHYGSYFCVLNGPVTTSGDGFCYKGTPNERAAV